MRSTGPRTASGKARSALNARLHGLSSFSMFSVEELELIEEMALSFAGDENLGEHVLELSRRAAEHQLTLRRVQEARQRIWEAGDFKKAPKSSRETRSPGTDNAVGTKTDLLDGFNALEDIARLVRYERRATHARDTALRELEVAKWSSIDASLALNGTSKTNPTQKN